MPSMPRPKGKAKKLAYKLLGIPANMQSKRDAEQQKINNRLIFEETARVR